MDQIDIWNTVKTFRAQAVGGEVVVRVNRMETSRRFSCDLGWERKVKPGETARTVRYFPILTTGQGKIEVYTLKHIFKDLVEQVETYVQSECQKLEDAAIGQRMDKELRDLNRDKPKIVPGLGKLGLRDKKGA